MRGERETVRHGAYDSIRGTGAGAGQAWGPYRLDGAHVHTACFRRSSLDYPQ